MKCKHCGAQLHCDDELCLSCGAIVEKDKTVIDDGSTDEAAAVEIVADEPVADEPVADEPVADEPVASENDVENNVDSLAPVNEKPAAPISIWKVIAATAVCMLLLCVLAVMLINSIAGTNWPFDQFAKETTAAPTTTTAATEAIMGAEEAGMLAGITEKDTYSAETLTAGSSEKVIATAGSMKLTNGQLQILYWSQFYNFVNSGEYANYGLDPYAPLSEQKMSGVDATWEQYFLNYAINTWHRYAAFNIAAQEDNYVLPEEVQKSLDEFIDQFNQQAIESGFASGQELLTAQMGPGVTLDDLLAIETLKAVGDGYFNQFRNSLNPTREEVEAYFDENAELFSTYYGVTKDSGKMVDVRHVLLQPKDCEFDENNYVVATDAQWESCRKEAQALLDAWVKDGATEEGFAEVAKAHSVDGSAEDGGLIQYVSPGYMVENFDAWLFDESRKVGDYGLVKTEFGYHLMYYVSGEEAWYLFARESSDGILSRKCTEKIDAAIEANPLKVKFADITLGVVQFASDEAEDDATAATE